MDRRARRVAAHGFTLVELLVVVAIVSMLMALLLPSLGRARQVAKRTQCLSNIRQLQIAEVAYAGDNRDLMIYAGDSTEQGSWIGPLQHYGATAEARRCPADASEYFSRPLEGTNPPRLRTTSYGINNYVSPTHAPFGREPIRRLSQVERPARVVQLGELAEIAPYAGSDHFHVQDFYLAIAPQISIALIDNQMALGRHGGEPKSWGAQLNFSFLDGHAMTLPISRVYRDPSENLFDPLVAR